MDKIDVVEYKGQRMLTTKQIAEAYGTGVGTIQYNFRYNKKKYEKGKHYVEIVGDELKKMKSTSEIHLSLKQVKHLYLWTEKGALLHAKSINTDKAWEVYENLVDFYFRVKEKDKDLQNPEKKAVVPVTVKTEKVPEPIETKEPKMKSIPVYSMNQLKFAKKTVVDIPVNKEALELIAEMRKYLTGMEALLDIYCMFVPKEDFEKTGHTIHEMSGKIAQTAFFLSTFKPKLREEYNA